MFRNSFGLFIPAVVHSIAYGNGTFVAVGSESRASYSYDGINWTALPNGTDTGIKFGTSNVFSVTYGNGTFVAVGAFGKASYSYNGINWTALPNGTDTGIKFGTYDAYSVAYGNGIFVAGSIAGNASYSYDGITWTTLPAGVDTGIKFGTITKINGLPPIPVYRTVRSITYGNGTFVAVGAGSKASYSYNGINWTALPNGTTDTGIKLGIYDAYSVAYGNGTFVAVGGYGKASYSTLDLGPPVISSISPPNEMEYFGRQTNVTFTFNVTDSHEIANCSVYVLDSNGNPFTNKSNETAIVKSERNNISILIDYGNYSWYVNCTDSSYAGNIEGSSEITSFSILYTPPATTSTTETTSSGGSSTTTLGDVENFVGKTNYVRYGFQNNFNYGGESHKFVLRQIDKTLRTAKIDVYSDKMVLTLNEGSSENVDLDGDGEFDLVFYLDKIYDDKVAVDLRIENYEPKVSDEVELVVNDKLNFGGIFEEESIWAKWGLIFGVILVAGILIVVVLKGTKKVKGEKKKRND